MTKKMTDKKYTFPGISVFCGRSEYAREIPENKGHVEAIQSFGRQLAENDIPLIWGAGEYGLMGAVSKATLEAGGKATGVITRHLLYGEEGCQKDLTMLLIADDMQARKLAFSKLSCAFVVFPGGAGTGDELFEYLAEREYNEHTKPLIVVNITNYFDPFFKDIEKAVQYGDIPKEVADMIYVVNHEDEILPLLEEHFKRFPIQDVVMTDVTTDEIRHGFGEDLHMGPPGAEGGRLAILKDMMIPLELVGPKFFNKSVMLWCGAQPAGLYADGRDEFVTELNKFLDLMGDSDYRLIHSGMNTGLKGVISDHMVKHDLESVAVTTQHKIAQDLVNRNCKNLLVRRNEQSVDYALKALSSIFVVGPGGTDTREKYFEFLTEVDVEEHNKPVILWNHNGYYDELFDWLEHLAARGYLYKKTFEKKINVANTAEEVMQLIKDQLTYIGQG